MGCSVHVDFSLIVEAARSACGGVGMAGSGMIGGIGMALTWAGVGMDALWPRRQHGRAIDEAQHHDEYTFVARALPPAAGGHLGVNPVGLGSTRFAGFEHDGFPGLQRKGREHDALRRVGAEIDPDGGLRWRAGMPTLPQQDGALVDQMAVVQMQMRRFAQQLLQLGFVPVNIDEALRGVKVFVVHARLSSTSRPCGR